MHIKFPHIFVIFFLACKSEIKTKPLANLQNVDFYTNLDTNKYTIYLTFDDGALTGTSNCYTICKNMEVPASFFMIGWHVCRTKKAQKIFNTIKIDTNQFEVYNHSYTHAYGQYKSYYKNPHLVVQDFKRSVDSLNFTNNHWIRLPGINIWNYKNIKYSLPSFKKIVDSLDKNGFKIVGWDIEWEENKFGLCKQDPDFIYQRVNECIQSKKVRKPKNLVLLMHDNMYRTTQDSLKLVQLIVKIKQNPKFQFANLSNYPN